MRLQLHGRSAHGTVQVPVVCLAQPLLVFLHCCSALWTVQRRPQEQLCQGAQALWPQSSPCPSHPAFASMRWVWVHLGRAGMDAFTIEEQSSCFLRCQAGQRVGLISRALGSGGPWAGPGLLETWLTLPCATPATPARPHQRPTLHGTTSSCRSCSSVRACRSGSCLRLHGQSRRWVRMHLGCAWAHAAAPCLSHSVTCNSMGHCLASTGVWLAWARSRDRSTGARMAAQQVPPARLAPRARARVLDTSPLAASHPEHDKSTSCVALAGAYPGQRSMAEVTASGHESHSPNPGRQRL